MLPGKELWSQYCALIHRDMVFLLNKKEKFLNSWNRCMVFPSISLQVCIHRERKHPPVTATPQELRDPDKRALFQDMEHLDTSLITKRSQEGETSLGIALKRHLNHTCAQDAPAQTDGHFISLKIPVILYRPGVESSQRWNTLCFFVFLIKESH